MVSAMRLAVLSREGVRCAVSGRDRATVERSARSLKKEAEYPLFPVVLELTDVASIHTAVQQTQCSLGGIDILINCAARASGGVSEDFEHVAEGLIRRDFEEKVLGTLHCVRAVIPAMSANGWGGLSPSQATRLVEPDRSQRVSATCPSSTSQSTSLTNLAERA